MEKNKKSIYHKGEIKMTFKEAMIEAMTSRGMFPTQATEVIEKYIEENKDDSMRGRWMTM